MQDIYDNKIIPKILKTFKIKDIVISGITDNGLLENIYNYDANFTQINTPEGDCIKDNPLNILPKLGEYDAIFLNDDSNWYTVFNELNIIKNTNTDFPLVFICNNNFPNKRRDSYINPDSIPTEFRQKYDNKLSICYNDEKITITDGLYHACDENTPKNGVLTAIEDFLKENSHIGIMKINFIKEICILYPKLQINEKRISILTKNIQDSKLDNLNLSDKLIENQLLVSYINKYNLYDNSLNELETEISKKESIINDFKNKVRLQNNELNLKDAKLNGIESNLNLKDSQIKNIESKLVNRNKRIGTLENQLQTANKKIYSLNQEAKTNSEKITQIENQLKNSDEEISKLKQKELNYSHQINSMDAAINKKNESLKNNQNQINTLKNELTQKHNEFTNQISIKNENIKQKDTQINTLKNELNNKSKKLQQELDEKNKRIDYFKHSHTRQLSEIENTKYCISCFKEEIDNNHLEIKYLKNNTLTKKIFSPLAYIYLILKSEPKEISLNIRLYRALKDSKCFDIGYYLNNNKDLTQSKWCKYFSPELHYVCYGFDEKRTFNKKYFVRNSKKVLFDYLLKCEK